MKFDNINKNLSKSIINIAKAGIDPIPINSKIGVNKLINKRKVTFAFCLLSNSILKSL